MESAHWGKFEAHSATVKSIQELIFLDKKRLKLLELVADLALPDSWIGAGFVRNSVWDYLHDLPPTPLNDVDVIFFSPREAYDELKITESLALQEPSINWEVKNQARMHVKHGDKPYHNCAEAMMHWPEKETAVAVRLDKHGDIELCAPFGTGSLFRGEITHNKARSADIFRQRLQQWTRQK